MVKMEDDKEIEMIGRYLSTAHRTLLSRIDEKLSDYDIRVAQLHLLFPLFKKEGINQKELARIFNLDKGAVGRGLQKLEEKGFIRREEDPEDNRRNLLFLTDKTKELKPELIDILDSVEEEAEKNLSQEEIETFTETVEKICENLGVENIEETRVIQND